MLPTLLSQIVSEIALNYPQASPEDIANILINSIETKILPNAIRTIVLPPPPSKARMLLERKHEERRRKKYRASILEDKMELARNLESLKYRLSGEEVDNTSRRYVLTEKGLDDLAVPMYGSLGASSVREHIERRDGVPLPKGSGFSRFGRKLAREKNYPYTKGIAEKETETEFFIDSRVQDKLLSDPLFMNVISSIEVFLRNIALRYPEASFSILKKSDPQIPTWEKIIVKLTIPNSSFDEKMRIWDYVDVELRKTLRKMAQESYPSRIDEMEDVNRRLFTHLDL
jgi:hypothetical protein